MLRLEVYNHRSLVQRREKINSDSSDIINSMTEFIKLKMEYLQFGSVESHIMKHGKKA